MSVTVHLSDIGRRCFAGPDAIASAEEWATIETYHRDNSPDAAETSNCAAAQVMRYLQQHKRATPSTIEKHVGFSRPTISRVLHNHKKLGKVRDLPRANARDEKTWAYIEEGHEE